MLHELSKQIETSERMRIEEEFWTSVDDDIDYQLTFNSVEEEDRYFKSNIKEEERNAILANCSSTCLNRHLPRP